MSPSRRSRSKQFQIVALRSDGHRDLIAVGIPARVASKMRRSMTGNALFANLKIEPMQKHQSTATIALVPEVPPKDSWI